MPGLTFATPAFRKAIEGYIAAGGKFGQDKKDGLKFDGAALVNYTYEVPSYPPVIPTDWGQREHNLALTPTFAHDLADLLGPRPYSSNAPADTMLLNIQPCGAATYLLMGNNTQDPDNTRQRQMDPIPLDTSINVPASGVIYDLFNGGVVPVAAGKAPLHFAAGDGACWLHLPAAPGAMKLDARAIGNSVVQINLTWGSAGYLPFRLRLYDPAGNKIDDIYRATTPVALKNGMVTTFSMRYPLGDNAAPGAYRVEISEWMTGSTVSKNVTVKPGARSASAQLNTGDVSIYFDDAKKISDLFAGKPLLPPYEKMHWELARTMGGLDAKKFAVFGPAAQANAIAEALRAKGMTVSVNPEFKIIPFTQEPGHGGTGPLVDNGTANFENIYAHAIVLAGDLSGKEPWQQLGQNFLDTRPYQPPDHRNLPRPAPRVHPVGNRRLSGGLPGRMGFRRQRRGRALAARRHQWQSQSHHRAADRGAARNARRRAGVYAPFHRHPGNRRRGYPGGRGHGPRWPYDLRAALGRHGGGH